MPFDFRVPEEGDPFAGGFRPQVREVDIGGQVIDLASMKEQFERSRTGGGDTQ